MNNWKIGKRITAGFAAVITIAIALGVFSFVQLLGINKNTSRISVDCLPGVYSIGQIDALVKDNYGKVLEHITATDPQQRAKIGAEIQENVQRIGAYAS